MPLSSRDKILRFIGMARRAGKIVFGFEAVRAAVLKDDVFLLIVSEDVSPNTLNKLIDVGKEYSGRYGKDLSFFSFGSKDELGTAIGKDAKAVIGITDKGFSDKLSEMLEELDETDNNRQEED